MKMEMQLISLYKHVSNNIYIYIYYFMYYIIYLFIIYLFTSIHQPHTRSMTRNPSTQLLSSLSPAPFNHAVRRAVALKSPENSPAASTSWEKSHHRYGVLQRMRATGWFFLRQN